jgi:hypothetical protein
MDIERCHRSDDAAIRDRVGGARTRAQTCGCGVEVHSDRGCRIGWARVQDPRSAEARRERSTCCVADWIPTSDCEVQGQSTARFGTQAAPAPVPLSGALRIAGSDEPRPACPAPPPVDVLIELPERPAVPVEPFLGVDDVVRAELPPPSHAAHKTTMHGPSHARRVVSIKGLFRRPGEST